MKKGLLKLVSLLMVLSLLLTACGGGGDKNKSGEKEKEKVLTDPSQFPQTSEGKGDPIEGGTLTVGLVTDSPFEGTLDWNFYSNADDADILKWFSEPIFGYDANYNISNEVESAAKFEISEDFKQITITIQDGVYWHDGHQLTAEDYVYSYYIIGHPDYVSKEVAGSRYGDPVIYNIVGMEAYHNGETDTIEGIELLDEMTVRITWTEANPSLMQGIWAYATPKHYYVNDETGEQLSVKELVNSDKIRTKPIGFGPFKVQNVVPGESVQLVAFEDYYGGKPKLDGVIIKTVPTATVHEEIKAGKIDIASFPTNQYEIGMETPNFELLAYEENAFTYIGFKLGHWDADAQTNVMDRDTPLQDVELRKAFGYAMDNQTLAERFYKGLRTPATTLMIPFFKEYHNPDIKGFTYDPEKAKEILDNAGYKDVDGDGYREDKDGNPMVFNFASMSGGETAEPIAQWYIQNWKEVGLHVQLLDGRLHEINSFYDMVELDDPDIDLYQAAFGTGTDPNPYGLWHSKSAWNYPRFVNAENDRLLEEGSSEKALFDLEFRKDIYNQWQELMVENPPVIPTLYRYALVAVNDRVVNYTVDPTRTDLGYEDIAVTSEEPIVAE